MSSVLSFLNEIQFPSGMELEYVANQLTPEGLDEIQRLVLAYSLGQHVAISGPPGVGKTDAITQLPKIVNRDLFDISCDEYMTEGPIIGFPELEQKNGSTVTVWKNGVATEAAGKDGIFYGDEYDLLQGSVQKRCNPLFDHRRAIKRRDGKVIQGGSHFVGIVSYNPNDKLSRRELEDSVADRFVHLTFDYLPPKLEAALSLRNVSSLALEERAVSYCRNTPLFYQKVGKQWTRFFSGEKTKLGKDAITYGTFLRDSTEKNFPAQLKKEELAEKIADFFVSARSFGDYGTTKLPSEITNYLQEIGELTNVQLHKPSTRIIKAALSQYELLTELGMKPEKAQSHVTRLCIDQIGYGKFGLRQLGANSTTVHDAVTSLAAFYELVQRPRQRTDFSS